MKPPRHVIPALGMIYPASTQDKLRQQYILHRYRRAGNPYVDYPILAAHRALKLARQGTTVEGVCFPMYPRGYDAHSDLNIAGDKLILVAIPAWAGLRYVGTSEEILHLRHTGYFLDPDVSDETVSGHVYQTVARRGAKRFIAAIHIYDTGTLTIWVSRSDLVRPKADKETAANDADWLAERYSDEERDYRAAWRLGIEYDALRLEAQQAREEIAALFPERHAVRPDANTYLRAHVRTLITSIRKAETKRETLRNGISVRFLDAFLDGAGCC